MATPATASLPARVQRNGSLSRRCWSIMITAPSVRGARPRYCGMESPSALAAELAGSGAPA